MATRIALIIDMADNTGSPSATPAIRTTALGQLYPRWRDAGFVLRCELPPMALALGVFVAALEAVPA